MKDMEKPVLLLFDGHGSHLTYGTVKTAIDNSIIIMCLPPNTSHAFQPLDVGLFKPVKTAWKDILKLWSRESQLQKVDKAVFPHLLKKLWMSLNPMNVVGGFRGAGLYPVDPERLTSRIVSSVSESGTGHLASPGKKIANAVIHVLSPQASTETKEALANSSRSRKRVQAKSGEVLTHPEVVERLKNEHEERCSKLSKKRKTNSTIKCDISNNGDSGDNGSDTGYMIEDEIPISSTAVLACSKNLKQGVYVLAKVKPQFRYVVQLSDDYDDAEDYAPVTGLKCTNPDDADTFKEDPTDQFDISLQDVVEILPTPATNLLSSTRVTFTFPRKIQVKEK